MSKGTEADRLIIQQYQKTYNVSGNTARNHRRDGHPRWLEFCKQNGYNPNHKKKLKIMNEDLENLFNEVEKQQPERTAHEPEGLVQRYKQLEQTAFNQLRRTQLLLDEAITQQQFQTLKIYVGGVKDLTSTFNELCRLRQIAEVQEGNFLPMSILERYKSEFYPRLNSGVEELKLAIANALPPDLVPEFQRAWNVSYYRWRQAAKEAENALMNYKILAQEEALSALDKKENKRDRAKKHVRDKLKKSSHE